MGQITEPSGAFTSDTYDSHNNLTQTQVPTGAKASYAYANSSFPYLPSSTTDTEGNTTSFGYTSQGLLNSTTDPSNHTWSGTYNSNGTLAGETDENGHSTSYSYGTGGLLSGTTLPSPLGTESFSYDTANRLASSVDGKSQTTTYQYDALDRETKVAYADGSNVSSTYNADGDLTSQTDSTGTTSYTYDARGQLTSEQHPNGQTISYTYDPAGNLLSKTDVSGTDTYAYNPDDTLASVHDPSGAVTTFAYDADGNRITTSYPNGVSEGTTYDDAGQLTKIAASGCSSGTCPSFSYSYTNPSTNLPTTLRYRMTDASNATTAYTYDSLDRLTGASQTSSGGSQLSSFSYGYDPAGNLTSQTRNGVSTSLAYNAADELTTAGGSNYSFDANGNQLSAAGRSGMTYNTQDQVTGQFGPGLGGNAGYAGQGQSNRVINGASAFQYDALGLGGISTNGPATTSAVRSAAISVQDQPTSVAGGGTASYQVTVTNTGSQSWPSGGSTPVHLGIHFAAKGGGYAANNSTWSTDQRFSLPHDVSPGQSVTLAIQVSVPGTAGSSVLEAQMVQENVAWFPQYLDRPITVAGGSLAASYAVTGQPRSFSPGGSSQVQISLTNNGTSTWPAGGSTPVHLGVHFAAQGGGYGTSNAGTPWLTDVRISFGSDIAPGQSVSGTITVQAPSTPGRYVLEYQMVQENVAWFAEAEDSTVDVGTTNPAFPTGTTSFVRTPDGQLLSERVPNGSGGFNTYYYLYDGLGSVVGLTDGSGKLVNSYSYNPYGNTTSVSEQAPNPFRYTGAIWDASTGLYQMGERYYDPSAGRFTQQDPLGGGYQYAGDNPINAIDPGGTCPLMESPAHGDFGTPCGGGGYSNGGAPGDEPATDEGRARSFAEELRFTDTAERQVSAHGLSREDVAETITHGTRSPDTGGSRGGPYHGAYEYRYRAEIRGKLRYVKVVYSPSENLVLHAHYSNKPIP